MAIDSTAAKELDVLKKLKTRNQSLIDRMDKTYGYFRGDLFKMPEEEGKWDEVTSNRAPAEGWKMINVLSAAQRSIFNEAKKENRADRKKLNFNELLVSGLLFSAERLRDGSPESPLLQAEMAFFRVVRGWGAYRLLVMEDDDNEPYLDLAIWDRRNVSYISGRNRLVKVYYECISTEDEVKDEYPNWNGKGDYNGMVEIVDIWDCSKPHTKTREAVIAGNEYVKEPTLVKVGGRTIDYLPIRIKAGGAIPFVMDDNEDNIKKVGEDYLVNNRALLEVESRLMTYNLSAAGQEAGEATILKYDSTKSGGALPPEWNSTMRDPRGKKNVFLVDVGKGEEVGDLIPQAQGSRVQIALSQVDAKLNTGGLHPIASGEGGPGETAFGVDIRNRNTREHITPFLLAMQGDFVWMAQEITKQYKQGSFSPEVELSGYDSKAQWFSEKIEVDKIDPSKIFRCKLIVDELRDRAAHSGMAIQEKQAGLLPLREILDIHQLSDDPDSSIDALYQELADQMFDAPAVKGFLAKIKDFAKSKGLEERIEMEHAFKKLIMLEMQNQQQMGGGQGVQPKAGQSPQLAASSRRKAPQIPPEVTEAARRGGV